MTLPSFPEPGILLSSSLLIFSFLAIFLTNGEKNLSFLSISKLSSESNSSFFNKSIEGILAISGSLIVSSTSSMVNSLSFSLETIFISLLSSIDVSISAITSPTLTISFT